MKSAPRKVDGKFVLPPDGYCFMCYKPYDAPAGWYCKDRHKKPFRYPWEVKGGKSSDEELGPG